MNSESPTKKPSRKSNISKQPPPKRGPTLLSTNARFHEDASITSKSRSPPKSKQSDRSKTDQVVTGSLDPQKLKDINPDDWNNIPLPVCQSIKNIIEQLLNCIYHTMVFNSNISRLGSDIKSIKSEASKDATAKAEQALKDAKMVVEQRKDDIAGQINQNNDEFKELIEQTNQVTNSKFQNQIDAMSAKLKTLMDMKIEKSQEQTRIETANSVLELQNRIFESINIKGKVNHNLDQKDSIKSGFYRNLNDYLLNQFKEIKFENDDVFNKADKIETRMKNQHTQFLEWQASIDKSLVKQSKSLEIFNTQIQEIESIIPELKRQVDVQKAKFTQKIEDIQIEIKKQGAENETQAISVEEKLKTLMRKTNKMQAKISEQLGVEVSDGESGLTSGIATPVESATTSQRHTMSMPYRLSKIEFFLDSNLHWNEPSLLPYLEKVFMKPTFTPTKPKEQKPRDKPVKKPRKEKSADSNKQIKLTESSQKKPIEKPPTPKEEEPPKIIIVEDPPEKKSEVEELPSLIKREKYVVDTSERPQDEGSVNELLLKEKTEAQKRAERAAKNLVTVENLEKFSNLKQSDNSTIDYRNKYHSYLDGVNHEITESISERPLSKFGHSPRVPTITLDSQENKQSLSPRRGSPYNYKDLKTNKYVTLYQEQKKLQSQLINNVPSPLRQEDMKPMKVELNRLSQFISGRNSSQPDRSGAKTSENFFRPHDSVLASEYENMSEYAKMQRQSIQVHSEPYNLPPGIYNNGRRILFQATGKVLMPHDRILESLTSQRNSNNSFVGQDSVIISERTKSTKDFKGKHGRAATQMIITGQNRTIENAGKMPLNMIVKLMGPSYTRGSTAAFGKRNSQQASVMNMTDNGFFKSQESVVNREIREIKLHHHTTVQNTQRETPIAVKFESTTSIDKQ